MRICIATLALCSLPSPAAVSANRPTAEKPPAWTPLEWNWYSQYGQDKFIFEHFFSADAAAAAGGGPYRQGVFVELGAADGVNKSNTYAFEQNFGWTGVLIEPNTELFASLSQSRPNSICLFECVASTSGEYEFAEDGLNSGFSMHRSGSESIAFGGGGSKRFCRTLPDILYEHLGRHPHVDYLSLDLEGGELDILESLDFSRITVDVISIEVHDWRERERARRMTALLERSGFRFFDRLVYDDIWIRQRTRNLGCLHPGLQFLGRQSVLEPDGVNQGWAKMREALFWLLGNLEDKLNEDLTGGLLLNPPEVHSRSVDELIKIWDNSDPATLEAHCPVGMLVVAMAVGLITNRETGLPLDSSGTSTELRHQTIFHPTPRLQWMMGSYDYHDAVTLSEREGTYFEVRFPLGRAWYETSFLEAIESGWPLFGFLDLVARVSSAGGHLFEKMDMHGEEYHFPIRVPRPSCQLELLEQSPGTATGIGEGAWLAILPKPRGKSRGTRASRADVMMDSDACSLLGIAAARFHAARAEVLRLLQRRDNDRYEPLANWTVDGCQAPGEHLGAARAQGRCSSLGRKDCAALSERARAIRRPCLRRLRPAPGASLRLRRGPRLAETRAGAWIVEGERLMREFSNKHGLFITMWTLCTAEFAPWVEGAPKGDRAWEGAGNGETAFAVLHSLQQALLAHEGYLPQSE